MLRIEGLSKTYREGDAPVLADFDLALEDGEFVSLIGPSGCGKTTALRIVTGLLAPTAGTVEVNGRPSLGPSREKAIVFQEFNLFPWRTALANAAYGLEMQRVPKRERLATAAEYLERVGLTAYANHFPGQLSGGQRQRVGIARALAVRPKLLLMDEPFGALDALTREQLHGVLQQICDEEGVTVLFVTHSIDEAIYLSDRIVAMGVHPGRIIADIPVELPRPRDTYDWRAEPAYTTLRGRIWSLLEGELAQTQAVART
jgi:NitT/TauT family transport system ATP-binding protein